MESTPLPLDSSHKSFNYIPYATVMAGSTTKGCFPLLFEAHLLGAVVGGIQMKYSF